MRQEWYKNFRRNFLGHCIDGRFYLRNDIFDDQNNIHNSFDYGFICALEKLRYEIDAYLRKIDSGSQLPFSFKSDIDGLIEERIQSVYGDEFNSQRAERMRQKISENAMRIADDF